MNSTDILDILEGFTVESKSRATGNSKYETLFKKSMDNAGKYVNCADILDSARNMEHNKTNISSCAGKYLKRKELRGRFEFIIAAKDGERYLMVRFHA